MKRLIQSRVFYLVSSMALLLAILWGVYSIVRPFLIACIWGVVIGFTVSSPIKAVAEALEGFFRRKPWLNFFVRDTLKQAIATFLITVFLLSSAFFFLFMFRSFYQDFNAYVGTYLEVSEMQKLFIHVTLRLGQFIEWLPAYLVDGDTKTNWHAFLNDSHRVAETIPVLAQQLATHIWQGSGEGSGFGSGLAHFVISFYIFTLFVFGIVFSDTDAWVKKNLDRPAMKTIISFDVMRLYQDVKNIFELAVNVVLENAALQGLIVFICVQLSGSVPFHYALFLGVIGSFFTLLPAVGVSIVILPVFIGAIVLGLKSLALLMVVAQGFCFIDEWYLRQIYAKPFSDPLRWIFSRNKSSTAVDHGQYEIPSVMYLIAQIGGVSVFGLSGFIFGPIFLMLVKVLMRETLKTIDETPVRSES